MLRSLGLLALLLVAACGGGARGLALSFDAPPGDTAIVRAFDAAGDLVQEPRTLLLRELPVDLGPLPDRAVRLHLEYRRGGEVVAVGEEPVNGPGPLRQPQAVPLAEVRGLALDAQAERIPAGAPLRLRALGLLADGGTVDLTPSVAWTSSNPEVVDAGLRAVQPGSSTLSADLGLLHASLRVQVTGARAVELAPVPERITLPAGAEFQARVLARYDDGTVLDVTRLASAALSGQGLEGAGGRVRAAAGATGVLRFGWSGLAVEVPVGSGAVHRLELTPPQPVVPVGLRQPFRALAVLADGTRLDVTETAAWSGPVDGAGLAWSRAPGEAAVEAAWGGLAAGARLQVEQGSVVGLELSPARSALAEAPVRAVARDSRGRAHDVTGQVLWTSPEPTGAWVSPGLAGPVARATAAGEVTARLGSAEASAPVGAAAATLESLSLEPSAPRAVAGTFLPLRVTAHWSDGSTSDVTANAFWTPGDPNVVRFYSTPELVGVARAVAPGTTNLIVAHSGKFVEVPFTVVQANLQDLAVGPADAELAVGLSAPFVATGVFDDGTVQDLTRSAAWSTSDGAVASVTPRGVALGAGPGAAQVRAAFGGRTAASNLTVTAAGLAALEVRPVALSLAPGEEQLLGALGTFTDSARIPVTERVVWASSDPAVATVSNAQGSRGTVAALAPGSATVTATDVDSGRQASVPVTVAGSALVSLAVSPTDQDLPLGRSAGLVATGTYADGSQRDLTLHVGWTSSDPATASVGNARGTRGLVQALAPGQVTVTARHPGSGRSGTATVRATAASLLRIDLAPAGLALPLGVPYRIQAHGRFSDGRFRSIAEEAVWASSDPGVATVDNAAGSRGVVRGVAPGSVTLTVTDPGSGMQASLPLTVTDATLQRLVVSPADLDVLRGTTVRLEARGVFSDGAVLRLTDFADWSSSAPAVAPIDGGVATALGVGTTTLTARFSGVSGTAGLSVFDLRQVGTTLVGRWTAMEPSPDSRLVYATDSRADCLVLFDPEAGTEVGRVPVLADPSCLAVSPDGRTVLVGHSGSPDYALVDLQAMTVRRLAGALGREHVAVALGDDGRGYGVERDGYLEILDLASGTTTWSGNVGYGATSLAVDSGRKLLYVGNSSYDRVARYDVTAVTPGLQASAELGRDGVRLILTADGLRLIWLGPHTSGLGIGVHGALDFVTQFFVPTSRFALVDGRLSPDERHLYLLDAGTSSDAPGVAIVSLPSRRLLARVPLALSATDRIASRVALTPDGRCLLVYVIIPGVTSGEVLRFQVE